MSLEVPRIFRNGIVISESSISLVISLASTWEDSSDCLAGPRVQSILSLLVDTCREGSQGGSFLGLGSILSSVTNLGFCASIGCRTLGASSEILGGAGGSTG